MLVHWIAGVVLLITAFTAAAARADDAWQAHGKGDYERAWLQAIEPALNGDAQAQFLIGLMLANGQGVVEDRCVATLWYDKAARAGHAEARIRLAEAYDLGAGVKRDPKMAAYWRSAAGQVGQESAEIIVLPNGLPAAQIRMLDAAGIAGCQKSTGAGPKTERSEPPDNQAVTRGIEAFKAGRIDEALASVAPAAAAGDSVAQSFLAYMYKKGAGAPRNECLATLWADKAAREGDGYAAFALAFAYHQGFGVRADREMAWRWYVAADAFGYKDATPFRVDWIESKLNTDELAAFVERAKNWRPLDQPPAEIYVYPQTVKRSGLRLGAEGVIGPCNWGITSTSDRSSSPTPSSSR